MSAQSRSAGRVVAIVFLVMFLFFAIFASVAVGSISFILPIMFFIIVLIIAVARGAALGSGSRIQRPYTQQTAFSPPPPPDTMLVKCPYCMTNQPFTERCVNCGGPLPKPALY